MFSKSCKYAIKGVICISQKLREGSRIGVKDIAKSIGAPLRQTIDNRIFNTALVRDRTE